MIKKYIGLEIEMCYNTNLINLNIGDYHNGIKKGKYWKIEKDASVLNTCFYNWYAWAKPCECVSILCDTKKKVFEALKEFKDIFSQNGKYELNQVICFNSSTGSHIHFSTKKNKKELQYTKFIEASVLKKARIRVLRDIKKSNISSKREIIKRFFRNYAQKTNLNDKYYNSSSCRRQEYNFYSEYESKGFEWRSPNLTNISTWSEFETLFKIYFKHVEFMQKKLLKNKENITLSQELELNENLQNAENEIKITI